MLLLPAYLGADNKPDPFRGDVIAHVEFSGADGSTTYPDTTFATTGRTWANVTGAGSSSNLYTAYRRRLLSSLLNYYTGVATADHADWDFGASEWCLEIFGTFLNNVSADNSSQFIFTKFLAGGYSPFFLSMYNGVLTAAASNNGSSYTTVYSTGAIVALNTPYHFVLQRTGDVLELGVDGALVASAACTGSLTVNAARPVIGHYDWASGTNFGAAAHFWGFRATRAARYTFPYIVPLKPYALKGPPPAPGDPFAAYVVSVLNFATDFSDGSNKRWLARSGAAVTSGSLELDGVDDLIYGAAAFPDFDFGSGDWTIEVVVTCTALLNPAGNHPYPVTRYTFLSTSFPVLTMDISATTNNSVMSNTPATAYEVILSNSSVTNVINTDYHLQLCRGSNTYYLFKDGVLLDSDATSSAMAIALGEPLAIGGWLHSGNPNLVSLPGRVKAVRVTRACRNTSGFTPDALPWDEATPLGIGTNPNIANRVSHLRFQGSHGSSTFSDESGKTWTRVGAPVISTSHSVYGPTSGYFPSGGNYLETADHADWQFGAGDFVVEGWLKLLSVPNNVYLLNKGNVYTPILIYVSSGGSQLLFFASSAGASWDVASAVTMGPAIGFGAARWVEISRVGTNIYLFVDGKLYNTVSVSTTALWANSGEPFRLGGMHQGATQYAMDGFWQDFRVHKGTGGHTADYTPPRNFLPTT